MGRPSLGNQARTIQQGTKISRDEQVWLESLHGSAHKGLRAALDLYKLERMRAEGGSGAAEYVEALQAVAAPAPVKTVKPVRVAVQPQPVVPVDAEGTPIRCRIHRQWETLDEFFDKGVAMREKRCVKCGFLVVERAS